MNKILITLIGIIALITGIIIGSNFLSVDRYTIIQGADNTTFLLDKKTGLTWRNVRLSDCPYPNYWEETKVIIDKIDAAVPLGKKLRANKIKKDMKKQIKETKKAEKQALKEQQKMENQQQQAIKE